MGSSTPPPLPTRYLVQLGDRATPKRKEEAFNVGELFQIGKDSLNS